MNAKALKILKMILILAACAAWLAFVVYCWNAGTQQQNGSWVEQLMRFLSFNRPGQKDSVNTYLALAGFVFSAFYLTVLLPDLSRRFFPLKGKALRVFRVLIISLTGFAAFACVTGCLKPHTVPALEWIYANPHAADALRLFNSVLTPVSLFLIVFTWLLPVAVRFFRDAAKKQALKPAYIRKSVGFYGLLVILEILSTCVSAVLLAVVNAFSGSAAATGLNTTGEKAALLYYVFMVVILAPFIEETAFRGLIQHHVRRVLPAGIAIVTASVCFGLWHRNIAQFIYCSAFGVVAGVIYNATGKVRHTILMHALGNLFEILAFSTTGKAVFGRQMILPAIRVWLTDLPLVPAVLLLLLLILLMTAVTGSMLYLATGRENFIIRFVGKRRKSCAAARA